MEVLFEWDCKLLCWIKWHSLTENALTKFAMVMEEFTIIFGRFTEKFFPKIFQIDESAMMMSMPWKKLLMHAMKDKKKAHKEIPENYWLMTFEWTFDLDFKLEMKVKSPTTSQKFDCASCTNSGSKFTWNFWIHKSEAQWKSQGQMPLWTSFML